MSGDMELQDKLRAARKGNALQMMPTSCNERPEKVVLHSAMYGT